MPGDYNLIKQIVEKVFIGTLGTTLGIIGGILISIIVCPILRIILNILTGNKSIITIIVTIVEISCILIGGIAGCIGALYAIEIIKSQYNTNI